MSFLSFSVLTTLYGLEDTQRVIKMLAERPAMQMQRHQGPSLRPSTSPVLSCNGWIMASGLSSSHLEQQRRQRALCRYHSQSYSPRPTAPSPAPHSLNSCPRVSCRCQSTVRPGPGPGRPASQLDDPTLNKVPIALTMQPHLYTYLLDHTREHPVSPIQSAVLLLSLAPTAPWQHPARGQHAVT